MVIDQDDFGSQSDGRNGEALMIGFRQRMI